MDDVPQFGLGFAAKFARPVQRRMHLERKFVARIQDFYEQGKSSVERAGGAEQIPFMMFHQPAEIFSGKSSVRNDAHVAGTIADLPGFADRRGRWKRFAEEMLEI